MPSKRRRGLCGSFFSAFHVAVILDQPAFSRYFVRATPSRSPTPSRRRLRKFLRNGLASLLNPLNLKDVAPPSLHHHNHRHHLHATSPSPSSGDRTTRSLDVDERESDIVNKKSRSQNKSADEDNKHEHRIEKIVAHQRNDAEAKEKSRNGNKSRSREELDPKPNHLVAKLKKAYFYYQHHDTAKNTSRKKFGSDENRVEREAHQPRSNEKETRFIRKKSDGNHEEDVDLVAQLAQAYWRNAEKNKEIRKKIPKTRRRIIPKIPVISENTHKDDEDFAPTVAERNKKPHPQHSDDVERQKKTIRKESERLELEDDPAAEKQKKAHQHHHLHHRHHLKPEHGSRHADVATKSSRKESEKHDASFSRRSVSSTTPGWHPVLNTHIKDEDFVPPPVAERNKKPHPQHSDDVERQKKTIRKESERLELENDPAAEKQKKAHHHHRHHLKLEHRSRHADVATKSSRKESEKRDTSFARRSESTTSGAWHPVLNTHKDEDFVPTVGKRSSKKPHPLERSRNVNRQGHSNDHEPESGHRQHAGVATKSSRKGSEKNDAPFIRARYLKKPDLLGVTKQPFGADIKEVTDLEPRPALSDEELKSTWPRRWTDKFSEAELVASQREADAMAEDVRKEMLHCWRGYKQSAWGQDEVRPVTGGGHNWVSIGITILDSLDTLWLMDLKKEFGEGEEFVRGLNFEATRSGYHSLFEVTIRGLGGLLSAYSLSKRQVFLDKAADLGQRLVRAFSLDSGLPRPQVNLSTGRSRWTGSGTNIAEAGTLQLEFRMLAAHTKRPEFWTVPDKAFLKIVENSEYVNRGLVPIFIAKKERERTHSHLHRSKQSATMNASGLFVGSKISLGAMGDSYYEYLVKQWLQNGKRDTKYKALFIKAMNEMMDRLVVKTRQGTVFIAEENAGKRLDKMDHLACFVPGMLILGLLGLPPEEHDPRWFPAAEGVAECCYKMYRLVPAGLSPEYVRFDVNAKNGSPDMLVPSGRGAHRNLLRPEAIEALYYLHYYTGDPKYRHWAADMFKAFKRFSKAKYGYTALRDVRNPTMKSNQQESFWMAETMKYFYLIFAPKSTMNLHEYVLSTEAHPMAMPIQFPGAG